MTLRKLRADENRLGPNADWSWQEKMAKKEKLRQTLYAKRATMFEEVLADADVVSLAIVILERTRLKVSCGQICTTCLSASSQILQHIDFPMVFLDEASMATEPLSIVPLMKGVSLGEVVCF